jgi:hypothetical protein
MTQNEMKKPTRRTNDPTFDLIANHDASTVGY